MRALLLLLPAVALASDLVQAEFTSPLVPKPVPYAVLLPDGYKDAKEPLPLLLYLHGGGGDRTALTRIKGIFEEMWAAKQIPPMIIATPSVTQRCFYMDYKDGSEKWETLLVGPFREHLQKTYNASADPKKNLLMGPSMGGMGSLRIGFKNPERFGGLAALEPGIEPILKWSQMQPPIVSGAKTNSSTPRSASPSIQPIGKQTIRRQSRTRIPNA
jgi:S-formylglutathione hydrolase